MADLTSTSLVILALLGAITCAKSVSLDFSSFNENENPIWLSGDAFVSENAIQLTRNGEDGDMQFSVGRAVYYEPIPIWDKCSRFIADFTTEFQFMTKGVDNPDYGADGLAFFMAPVDSVIPYDSTGGWLGLFNNQNNGNFANQIVAVEFDTYNNEWDPAPYDHVGINIDNIRSTVVSYGNQLPAQSLMNRVVTARVTYDSRLQNLQVFILNLEYEYVLVLSLEIDLSEYLPESVVVGFSGATGMAVATHTLISWSFSSTMASSPSSSPAPSPACATFPIPSSSPNTP